MAKTKNSEDGKYMFSDSAPVHIIEFKEPGTKIISQEVKRGVYPFGPQAQLITDENLTNAMAEFLLSKDEFKNFIIKA